MSHCFKKSKKTFNMSREYRLFSSGIIVSADILLDKMAEYLGTIFSINQICFLGSYSQECIICLDNGLVPKKRQAIIFNNDDPVQRPIYAALG